ncbi:MAG: signal peptidase II, partial [Collinsella bouchesdurhonensis]|nr:signal peptidase II [Collinsella bouchesdurhonensis]
MKQQLPEMSPSRVWRFATAAGISALFLVLDQITKAVVRNALALGVPGPELIPGVIRLLYVQNVGAAFSLGEGLGGAFVLLALAVIAATVWYLWKTPLLSHLEVVGLAMVVG